MGLIWPVGLEFDICGLANVIIFSCGALTSAHDKLKGKFNQSCECVLLTTSGPYGRKIEIACEHTVYGHLDVAKTQTVLPLKVCSVKCQHDAYVKPSMQKNFPEAFMEQTKIIIKPQTECHIPDTLTAVSAHVCSGNFRQINQVTHQRPRG